MKDINFPLLMIYCICVLPSFPQWPPRSSLSLNSNLTALAYPTRLSITITIQGCFQSHSMSLGLEAARNQHESSGLNHRVRRSGSGILMRPVLIVGFPDLLVCPDGHTLAIWHVQPGTSPISFWPPQNYYGYCFGLFSRGIWRFTAHSSTGQRMAEIGQLAPYGQSCAIRIHYW